MRKLSESQKYISQFEIKIKELSAEIDRLNNKLKLEMETSNKYKDNIQRLSFENGKFKIV